MDKVFEKAKKEFEGIMITHCREYIMEEEDYATWNIKDFISECQYYIDYQSELDDPDNVADCKRFIRKYLKYAKQEKSTALHVSKYD